MTSNLDEDILGLMGEEDEGDAPVASGKRKRTKVSSLADSTDDDDDDDDDEDDESDSEFEEEDEEVVDAKKETKMAKKKKKELAKETESESESIEFNLEEFEDGFEDDLMGDEEDRKKLMAMTELDREMLLADRGEAREELQRQKQIMLNAKAARDAKKAAKRRATRSQARAKGGKTAKDKRKSALDALVARRDKKSSARDSLARYKDDDEVEYESYDEDEDDYGSDGYYEDLSDEDGGRRRRRAGARGSGGRGGRKGRRGDLEEGELDEDVEAGFEEVEGALVTRAKIAEWVEEPFFEEVMLEQFVRIAMGSRTTETGDKVSVYKLALVTEVVERKAGKFQTFETSPVIRSPYPIDDGNGNVKQTAFWLKLRIGTAEATFPISVVSSSKLAEDEFEDYCGECRKARQSPPMRSDVRRALASQREARDFRYSAADVWRKIEKGGGRKTLSYAFRKQDLQARIAIAQKQQDAAAEARFRADLEGVEREHREKLRRQQERKRTMTELNRKNVDENFKAILERTRGEKLDRRKSMEKADPFSRRPTAPLSFRAKKKGARDAAAAAAVAAGAGGNKPVEVAGEEAAGRQKEGMDAEPVGGSGPRKFPGIDLDFTVDVKLLERPRRRPELQLSSIGSTLPKNTKAISISDYFKRLDSGAV